MYFRDFMYFPVSGREYTSFESLNIFCCGKNYNIENRSRMLIVVSNNETKIASSTTVTGNFPSLSGADKHSLYLLLSDFYFYLQAVHPYG